MSSRSPVYVGVDGTPPSVEAADLGAAEAAARGADLVLVHVARAPTEAPGFDRAVERVRRRYPAVGFSCLRLPLGPATGDGAGDPAGALAGALGARAAGGALLVVGHRPPPTRRHPSHRSVAQRLIGLSPVPTLVYRAIDLTCPVPEPRPVLAGIAPHGSPDAVLEFATEAAAHRGARLDILCAQADPADRPVLDPAVEEAVQRWLDKYPEVHGRLHLRAGIDPAIALMVDSHTAQLVVVGAGDPANQASIAHALVHRAACPVAVVPTHAPRLTAAGLLPAAAGFVPAAGGLAGAEPSSG